MRLWRVFPWSPQAPSGNPGHPLWIPRELQGAGRHDNPDLYGAMYLSERAVAAVVEPIAHLRGQRLDDMDLERSGLRLAIVTVEARVQRQLWDLDDPSTLADRRLRPSEVATRNRSMTQRQAAALFRVRPQRAGIRWWSTLEASWLHVTLFDRSVSSLTITAPPEPLRPEHPALREAAEAIGVLVR